MSPHVLSLFRWLEPTPDRGRPPKHRARYMGVARGRSWWLHPTKGWRSCKLRKTGPGRP